MAPVPTAQTPAGGKAPAHAASVQRLLISNVMIIPGSGVPAYGPNDILVENGLIARIGSSTAGKWPAADAVIDGTGKYLMPGIVNTHMHWHEERVGPIPDSVPANLYLAAWGHDGSRSGWQLREDQTVARRECGAHDCRAAHRALSDAELIC